jgi:hypothetical protein
MDKEKTPWQKFLEKRNNPVTPFDLLHSENYLKNKEEIDKRLNICKGCDHFIKYTTQCTECKCIMNLKTRLTGASCPIGKW